MNTEQNQFCQFRPLESRAPNAEVNDEVPEDKSEELSQKKFGDPRNCIFNPQKARAHQATTFPGLLDLLRYNEATARLLCGFGMFCFTDIKLCATGSGDSSAYFPCVPYPSDLDSCSFGGDIDDFASDSEPELASTPCSPCTSKGSVQKNGASEKTATWTQRNTGVASVRGQPSSFSISDMLKWRSVVLCADELSGNVVCSAVFVKGNDPVQKNCRDGAYPGHQRKSNRKKTDWRETKSKNCASTQQVLKVSANSWSAQQSQIVKNSKSEGKSHEEIVRSMKSILNKLTMQKYDTLYVQILNCGMSTVEHVMILIDEVLEKAETQHPFIQMYCQLCVDLNKWFVERESSDGADTRGRSFKRILLTQCQNKFENNLQPPDLSLVPEDCAEEAMIKHKLAMLGNIRFVGALLEKGLLAESVLHRIAQQLCDINTPHTLESLACFLTAVGPTFDKASFRYYQPLQEIFAMVELKSTETSIAPRIRFLLRDLLDLRQACWS